jgi:hypothetical protein
MPHTPQPNNPEDLADELLAQQQKDPDLPVYTEQQMLRKGRRLVRLDVATLNEPACPQSVRDEIRFLASVSHMPQDTRLCLDLWIDGWTQQQIAANLHISQQRVSQRVRAGLTQCLDLAPISFRAFSYHTIYRPPRKTRPCGIQRTCAWCGEPFLLSLGYGRYCSSVCRETARRAPRRRRPTQE